jgi:hypothetical protein
MVRMVRMRPWRVRIGRHVLGLLVHGSGCLVYRLERENFSVVRAVLARLIQGVYARKADSLDSVERGVRWIERALHQTGNVLQGVC